jgi:hypothetical protein
LSLADLRGLGLDLDGEVRILASGADDQKRSRVELPFSGDAEAAGKLLTMMWGQPVVHEGGRFSVAGDEKKRAELSGGSLVLGTLASLSGEGAVFGAMPSRADVPGCVVRLRTPAKGDRPSSDLSAFLPSQGGAPLWLHATLPEIPAALRAAPVAGRSVASDIAPSAVITIGWDLRWMLSSVGGAGGPPIPDELRLFVGAGTTIAMFDKSMGGGMAMVAPRLSADGARLSKSALVLELKSAGGVPFRGGLFKFEAMKKALYVKPGVGELVAATSPELVADVLDGGANPWLSAEHLARAEAWPVAASMRMPAPFAGQMHGGVRVAAGGAEMYMEADRAAGQAFFGFLQIAGAMFANGLPDLPMLNAPEAE